ncbi:06bddf7d-e1fb-4113-973c-901a576e1c81 [Sclerotinia trifoliorum]|uniref:06bddf7d-e1fb-4113-973c-901a576e1c81 n=1 Tax=Sclerotinia trifoliorum TaxID=28548 RepID=A0A8H2ZMK6_9HELO|nr:06bddf7d-e1fb-4113-973c-901a576e1c81 [Sclerotinia trifoliorum]
MLRLPHVFKRPLSKFEAFGGRNSRAMDYCLDKPSYYRLMDRLGLSSGNDRSDIVEPGTQNNSIFSSIFSQLVSYLSVYNSTEDDPSQYQAETIYPGEDGKSLLFPFVPDILSLAKLNLSSGVECFTKAKSTRMGLELAWTGPSTT